LSIDGNLDLAVFTRLDTSIVIDLGFVRDQTTIIETRLGNGTFALHFHVDTARGVSARLGRDSF
jgi:hypothetical protein